MTSLVLYTNPMSRGRIARWMLEEVGVPYEVKVVAYGPQMKSPDYLAINPMGKVPALQHGDNVVTECAAIIAYLADVFPEANLAPKTEAERAAYYRWMFFAAGPLEAAVTNRSLGVVIPDDKRGMVGYGSYEKVIDTIETALSKTAYIAGDRFTGADVYVGSHLMWGMQFGMLEKRPAFQAYVASLMQRPGHRRAAELNEALAAAQQSG
ncbi:glutathione S-transferase family protein [Affinirhizobium pseudoryzae]|uniref:glutathione S-transferase family protein n=1 Tax=Allorhizobium pseudoryzae TaxID=379684 RepID=UPI0013EB9CA0|nr:glutathione S-transferase family protein [Allorhizobium pseudoryzae]